MNMVTKDSSDNADGDNDDNDGGLDNEDGECSLSTSCMMERGASLMIKLLEIIQCMYLTRTRWYTP